MRRGEFLVERCPSGVPGFDDICAGGFVRNSVNAVLGGPGAGKTIFLMEFLYNGCEHYNENGLYLSFEPDVVEIFKDASAFGWDFDKLDQQGKCKFIKISPQTDFSELKKELIRTISKYQIQRICIDPVNLFGSAESDDTKLRVMIFELTSLLKRLNVTVLLSNETFSADSEEAGMCSLDVKSQHMKFLVDGIVDLYSSGLGGVSDRAVRITKMRRTNHSRGPIPMQITDDGLFVATRKSAQRVSL